MKPGLFRDGRHGAERTAAGQRDEAVAAAAESARQLYPPREPYETGYLEVALTVGLAQVDAAYGGHAFTFVMASTGS